MQKLVDEAFESGVSNKNLEDIWTEASLQVKAIRGN